MEDTTKFVLENPQGRESRKKRPRVVTSCDNCRIKKIKCVPAPNAGEGESDTSAPCEACIEAGYTCKYRDRDRYYSERNRIMPTTKPSSSLSHSRPSSRASAASGSAEPVTFGRLPTLPMNLAAPTVPQSMDPFGHSYPSSTLGEFASQQPSASYSVDFAHASGMPAFSHAAFYDSMSPSGSMAASYPSSRSHVALAEQSAPSGGLRARGGASNRSVNTHTALPPLFNPVRPTEPHPALMPILIQSFFETAQNQCGFLVFDEVIRDFVNQNLSPLLANGIAAIACMTASSPALVGQDREQIADTYCNMAQSLISSAQTLGSLNDLYGTILIAWSTHQRRKASDFTAHAQMAMSLALDLGISDSDGIRRLALTSQEQNRIRSAWSSVVNLHVMPSA